MSTTDLDRVFGRSRLRMVTGAHVEVFREAARPGERRRYTKRFLATEAGDFRLWTEREWRILARLVGHGIVAVPEVVRFDRGGPGEPAIVQTYDAGVTVDHWATLLPLQRDGRVLRHVFDDCAHWWALAQHTLAALDAIHELRLVHLDLKPDNVCIPAHPADFDPQAGGQALKPRFEQLALIDFAFSLVAGDPLSIALPLARQPEYDYQSPRLLAALDAAREGDLRPTRQLDWRCDFYSLAAMLARYLPEARTTLDHGWTDVRVARARALVWRLFEIHDADAPLQRPHGELIAMAARGLDDAQMQASLQRGWSLAPRTAVPSAPSPTPITRIAMPLAALPETAQAPLLPPQPAPVRRRWMVLGLGAAAVAGAAVILFRLGLPAPVGGDDAALAQAPAASRAASAAAEQAQALPPVLAATVASAPAAVLASAPAAVVASAPGAVLPAAASAAVASASAPLVGSAASAAPVTTAADSAAPAVTAAASATPPGALAASAAPAPTAAAPAVPARTPAVAAAPAVNPKPQANATRALGREPVRAQAAPATKRPAGQAPALADARRARGTAPAGTAAAVKPSPTPAPAAAVRRTAAASPLPAAPPPGGRKVPWLEPRPAATTVAMRPAVTDSAQSERLKPSLPPVTTPAVTASPTPAPAAPQQQQQQPQPHTQPVATPPVAVLPPPAPVAPSPHELLARADRLVADDLPRVAERAERLVLRVLHAAARAEGPEQDEDIRRAAATIRLTPAQALVALAPAQARDWHRSALQAWRERGDAQAATELLMRAFAANPLDAEIAGDLAWLRLRGQAWQADGARQLALHALTLPHARHPYGRVDDWTTLAIASALTGRQRDAGNAWLVAAALTSNFDQLCRSAGQAYGRHGDRLRPSIDALQGCWRGGTRVSSDAGR